MYDLLYLGLVGLLLAASIGLVHFLARLGGPLPAHSADKDSP